MNTLLVNLIHGGRTIAMRPSMPGAGSGSHKGALVLYARPGVKFQLIDENTGAPPVRLVANRIRKRLELSLGVGEDPVVVIENYFDPSNANDSIVGEVGGVLKSYFPEQPVGIDIGEFNCDVTLILREPPAGLQLANLATTPSLPASSEMLGIAGGVAAMLLSGSQGGSSNTTHATTGPTSGIQVVADQVIDNIDDPHLLVSATNGVETLQLLGSGLALDLTQIGPSANYFHKIDITGTGNNLLKINATEIMSSTNFSSLKISQSSSDLVIAGDEGDRVILTDIAGWTNTHNHVSVADHVYTVWSNARFHLLIDDHITVS